MITRRLALTGLASLAAPTLAGPFLSGSALAQTAPVSIFAAASLQTALTAIAGGYGSRAGGPLRLTFGASSAMARQIAQGAPADLFISADEEWMDWLAERKLVIPGARRDLLANRLVLIAPKASKVKLTIARGMPLAKALAGGRLAVADTTAVPAGKYGRRALESLGVWDSVADRLAPAENVRAALAYVARGETPLGIVYATDARAEPGVRVVGVFPAASHPKILYPAALVKDTPAARAVLAYLRGPQAMKVFTDQGFLRP
jgi:molybdate transport system substrate-binding protein